MRVRSPALLGTLGALGALQVLRICRAMWRRLRAARLARGTVDFDEAVDRSAVWTVKHGLAPVIHGEAAAGALKLWVADMDFPCCPAIRGALEARARHPTYGYTYQPRELWEAVAAWLRERHAWDVEPSSLFFAPSVVTSFATAVRSYTQPGDRVLVN